ncbi:hypothetical protein GGR50DRAFT_640179 [Xylaria sp. CBS 124048]|nr:hypothetical protein GGR50DRAFT_640179 [Xylaria sp. CBS 124048]
MHDRTLYVPNLFFLGFILLTSASRANLHFHSTFTPLQSPFFPFFFFSFTFLFFPVSTMDGWVARGRGRGVREGGREATLLYPTLPYVYISRYTYVVVW